MLRDMLEQSDMERLAVPGRTVIVTARTVTVTTRTVTVPVRTVTMMLQKGKIIGNGSRGQSWSLLQNT